jgi:drug/metabolite transporter (DMT)-like permease
MNLNFTLGLIFTVIGLLVSIFSILDIIIFQFFEFSYPGVLYLLFGVMLIGIGIAYFLINKKKNL